MALTSAPLLALWILHLVSSSDGLQELTAHPGDNVTLECEGPNNAPIKVLELTRPDLVPEYVFFYRNKLSDPTHQNPSFTGRVELLDREIKNGNLSLILKNVNRNDTGTYKCRFATDGTRRRKRATEHSSIIILKVKDAIDEQASRGQASRVHDAVGGVFAVVAIIGVVGGGFVKFRKHDEKKNLGRNSDVTAADKESDQQLV
ncbi:uncharacterized protein LOC139926523 [Centroberyx gerrardi]